MCSGTSCVPARITATLPGLTACWVASRTAPRPSITPGTSLPAKTSIDSNAPVATTIALGCGHDEQVGPDQRHLGPLVEPERAVLAQQLDALVRLDLREQIPHGVARRARPEPAARVLALVGDDHRGACLGRAERGGQACRACAQHDDVGVPVDALEVAGEVALVDLAEARPPCGSSARPWATASAA